MDPFINKCLVMFKQPEVQKEIHHFIQPLINIILSELFLYVYIFIFLIFLIFTLILGIFIILLRNKKNINFL